MPEGDTVHKLAVVIRDCLAGQRLTRVQLRGIWQPERLTREPVERVEAVGKHLLIQAGPLTLRVHLGMHGAWSRHAPGPGRSGEVVLATERDLLICRRPRDVELMLSKDRGRHPALRALGPDLLGPEPDYEQLVRRARAGPPQRLLGEVLLDQRVAAGLGNVYKSELTFLGPHQDGQPFFRPGPGLSPWLPLSQVTDEQLGGLYRRGREALLANLGGWPRTTTWDRRAGTHPPGRLRLWVYERAGLPCLVCRVPLQAGVQGEEARATWWCPLCQGTVAAGQGQPKKARMNPGA